MECETRINTFNHSKYLRTSVTLMSLGKFHKIKHMKQNKKKYFKFIKSPKIEKKNYKKIEKCSKQSISLSRDFDGTLELEKCSRKTLIKFL